MNQIRLFAFPIKHESPKLIAHKLKIRIPCDPELHNLSALKAHYETETWMYYSGTSPPGSVSWPGGVPWPSNITQRAKASMPEHIHDRLLGRAVRYSVNGPTEPLPKREVFHYFKYDAKGKMIGSAERVSGNWAVTAYEYHPVTGELSKITDPNKAVTDIAWNYGVPGKGYTRTIINRAVQDAEGRKEDIWSILAYSGIFGVPLWEKDGRGYVTSFQHDKLGRPTLIRRPDGGDDTNWNPNQEPRPAWRDNNPETRIAYNDTALMITVTDPLGNKSIHSFAHDGQMIEKTRKVQSGYALRGNPLNGEQTIRRRWEYDAHGRMTGYQDPENLKMRFSYDAQGRMIREEFHSPNGSMLAQRRYEYTIGGSRKTIHDELNNKSIEYYDMNGNLLKQRYFSSAGALILEKSFSYDALGNAVSSTDAEGSSTVSEYNERNQPIKVTLPETDYFDGTKTYRFAAYTRNEYDLAGHLTAQYRSSRRGEDGISMEVDALGRVVSRSIHIRDENGAMQTHTSKNSYDKNGNLIGTIDPLGNEIRRLYTAGNQLQESIDAGGGKVSYTYDVKGRRTSITDQRGSSGQYGDKDKFTIDFHYDEADRLIRGILPSVDGRMERGEVRFAYDSRGNLLARIQPDGSRIEYSYSPRHWKLSETVVGKSGDGSERSYTTRFAYDRAGRMRTLTQPGGEQARYEYDALGRVLEETLPDGSQSRNVWDIRGLLNAHIDAIGAVTRYSYDELGRMVSLEDPEGHVSHNRYDQKNNIARYIDPAGEPFTAWFDERGLVRREEDSRGRKKSFGYDAAGRLQTLIDARGTRIDYTYTPASLIERINYTNGSKSHTQSFTYDEAGALKTASDNGVVTRYNHQNGIYIPNPFDLTTTIDESLKGRTLSSSYSYDIMQRLNSVGYSNNDKIVYQYNTLGELEGITGYMDNTGFDANGRLTGYELANGVRSRYEYDVKGRVTSMDYHDADGQAAKSYRFAYDLVDNIIQRNEEYYSYDRKGQMLSAVIGGLMGTEEYPLNQDEFQFGSVRSDVRSELPMEIPGEELTLDWGAGSLGIDLGYAYMIKKIVLKLKGGSGEIRKEQIALSTSMHNREELFKEQEFDMREAQDGTLTFILRGRSYSRYIKIHSHINPLNADGEPIRPAEVFELDTESVQVYALSGGKNVFYRYAPDGDRQSRAEMTDQIRSDEYAYYPMSDLVRIVGTYAYRYDENGNLLEKGDVYDESGEDVSIEQSGDYTLFEYDLLNRLVSVSKIDEDTGALRQVVSYRYNHKNLRIERTDTEGTTRYVFDLAGSIIEEHDAEGLTRYVFRNNKHLAKITPDGKTYYYGTDNLGSTTVLFDEEGNAVWKGEISAFGDVVLGEWIGEELFDERVRFTGKDYDEVTGLYYFNARWYDPQLGRFTSEDPIRDGINWHVYTYNNPLKYTDPTGLDPHNMTIEEADRRGWADPTGKKPGPGSSKRTNKQNSSTVWKERKSRGVIDGEKSEDEERSRSQRNGGWKQRRMERGGFIPEGTYSSDEIDSLYSIYKLDRALTAAEREGRIDQPSAEDLRNAIGDAKMLLLDGTSGEVRIKTYRAK